MLGPALYIVCINDVDASASSSVLADDTKLYSNVCTSDQSDRLQCDWSTMWRMLFNADKCKRLHVGHSYHNVDYSIGGAEIKKVTAEKDSGNLIYITQLKFSLLSTCNR